MAGKAPRLPGHTGCGSRLTWMMLLPPLGGGASRCSLRSSDSRRCSSALSSSACRDGRCTGAVGGVSQRAGVHGCTLGTPPKAARAAACARAHKRSRRRDSATQLQAVGQAELMYPSSSLISSQCDFLGPLLRGLAAREDGDRPHAHRRRAALCPRCVTLLLDSKPPRGATQAVNRPRCRELPGCGDCAGRSGAAALELEGRHGFLSTLGVQ